MWQLGVNGLNGWSAWDDIDAPIAGDPTIFQNADGHLEVFGRGRNGFLGHTWQVPDQGWSPWEDLGPPIEGDPAVFANADGRLELFARGLDGVLGHMWQTAPSNGWSAWDELGPRLSGDPVMFQNTDGRLEVFAAGPDGVLGHIWQTEADGHAGWADWEALGPVSPGGRLAVGQSGTSEPDEARPRPESRVRRSSELGADVLVIGAGPAGVTVADGLVRAGARVVLADSGAFDYEHAAQELNEGVADGPIVKHYTTYLRDGRRRQVQGSAAGWGPGWCMPFRSLDFGPRTWVADGDWPFAHEELAPYETRAAATFGFDPFPAPEADDALARLIYRFPPDPQLFRTAYLDLLAKPLFHPELRTTLVELRVRGDGVESARLVRSDGDELQVTADTFVLAAGAVENARLLLLHERTIPTSALTGRFFMEHPHVLAGTVRIPETAPLEAFIAPGPHELAVLSLADAVQAAEGLLNASVQLRPRYRESRDGYVDCELYVRAEQAPNPDSRVVLGDRLDRHGLPQAVLHWRLLEQDWESVVRTAARVAAVLEERYGAMSQLSIRTNEAWPDQPVGPGESWNATWGNHHMGTTRMADGTADGVVDRNSLLRGTANLYVAGSSVFPTGGCANPTFMIVALAHRLVDHLTR
jgi:choline dehydrogenase-like flavoprotein